MVKSLIQDLLKVELLQIPDSDERLKSIELTAAALREKLEANKILIPETTLVALDPNIGGDNHLLESTEILLVENWKSLRAGIKERPVPILRAILLEALYQAGQKDPVIARIIYLTGSNFHPYAQLGRERNLVDRMLEELGTFAEQDAAKEWTLVEEKPDLQFPALQLHGLTFSGIDINKDNLKGQLVVAIGRDPNTGHTVQNNTPNWHNHFGETAAFAIAETMRSALQNFSGAISPDSLQAPINNFFDAFKAALNDTLQSALRPIYAVERRSRLLWWKETLYSPYLKGSYRAVSAMVQPIVLAFDLFDLLPPVAPASVDYLLIDTLLLLNPNADEKMEIGDFLSALPKPECSSLPADILSNVQPEGDRISLTGFLGGLYKGKTKIADLKARTGIAGNSPISLAGLAINLLHDLMTERLITS